MAQVDIKSRTGASAGSVELDDAIFGVEPNVPVMHQVVTAQLAAARAGTQSTLTRAEVRGGGKKPWRQKGTGRARQGSTRAPHWAGGGVALGPKPRDYRQKTPKKMVQLALRSALSDRAAEGRIAVVEQWDFAQPKTRDAIDALGVLGTDGKVLIVIDRDDEVAFRSFRNIWDAQLILVSELNAYDVLCNDWIVFTRATLLTASAAAAPGRPATTPPPAVPTPPTPTPPTPPPAVPTPTDATTEATPTDVTTEEPESDGPA
ncbi:MAG: rplD [Acidimicrobiales bacterium]|jgi:large subunit ribosomal protein L4|nr:rplD [Acidimicrobiales bacterium]